MSLNEVARRYADNIFKSAFQATIQKQSQELAQVAADHAKRGLTVSGPHVMAHVRVLVDSIRIMGEAKADGLLRAYAQSGQAFDEAAFREVKSEVIEFCSNQQANAVGAIGHKIQQLFGAQAAPDNI